MALSFHSASKMNMKTLFFISLALTFALADIGYVEDRDLSGCSVEMKGFIFNLNGLKRGKKYAFKISHLLL
jgi:hypothetical protein